MEGYCVVCGRPAEAVHHLIFGVNRKNSDDDNLTIKLCNSHHNMGSNSLHDNSAAESLSKMLGQALWERQQLLEALCIFDTDFSQYTDEEVRNRFRKRFGRSFL